MSNYVLQRPETVAYMTSASSYSYSAAMSASALADAKSLGSCREATFEMTAEQLRATSTTYNDAVVATALTGYEGTLTLLLEEITTSAMLLGYDMSANGSSYEITASLTVPINYALIVEPWPIDGINTVGIFTKCNLASPPTRKLSRDQELLELKFAVLVDTDASAGKQFVRFLQEA